MRILLLLLFAIGALHSTKAHAEILALDLFAPNDGLVTRDTGSGLDWLDLTLTQQLAFNDIQGGAGPQPGGWIGDGWRYATGEEVCVLSSAFGLPIPSCPANSIDELEGVAANSQPGYLVSLHNEFLGLTVDGTNPDPRVVATIGFYDDHFGDPALVGIADFEYNSETDLSLARVLNDHSGAGNIDQGQPHIGSFLVRPIPEPSTGSLFLAGLLVLSSARRRLAGGRPALLK